VIDAGPQASASIINIPYVSVTVCTPGTTAATAACQTIDHVLLDTGSSGLRLLHTALYSNLNLPVVTRANGQALGECLPFISGTTWGSVRRADIYLGGEVAKSVTIQDIGDTPGGATAIPKDCSSTGRITDTQTSLGANGILGVGLFVNDCDVCLTTAIPAAYYLCGLRSCANTAVSAGEVVQNPVALFAQDNNGTLIDLPSVAPTGVTGPVTGTLVFGIGTQANNALGGTTAYATDASGNFQTTYKGSLLSASFIDSGSNALYFDDATIKKCTRYTWAYCPVTDPTSLSATTAGASGTPGTVIGFSITNLQNIAGNVVAASFGGTGAPNRFDWGLPFFFGRPVFTAIEGKNTPYGPGPYWAY
jgi:hypothetical protein